MNPTSPTSAKIVSSAESSTWSYIFEFKVETKSVFIVVAKKQTQNIAPETIWNGQNPTLVELKEKVLEFERQFPRENILKYCKDFVDITKDNFSLHSGNFEIAVVVISSDLVFLASFGAISVLLLRRGQLVALNQDRDKTATVTGKIEPEDVICIGTSDFIKSLPKGVLKASMTRPVSTIVEELAPAIVSQGNPFISVIFISYRPQVASTKLEKELPIIASPYVYKKSFKSKIVDFLDRIIAKLPQKRLYISPIEKSSQASRRKRLPILIGVALLVVLVISVVFGIKRQERLKVEQLFSDQLTVARDKLEEAKTLKAIDQTKARELLLEANIIVTDLKDADGRSQDYDLIAQSISENLGEIGGIYIADAKLYLDLALVSSGFTGEKLIASEGRMLVLDRERDKLVSIEIDSKKTQIIAGPNDLENVQDIAMYVNRNFVLDDEGIKEITSGANKILDKSWGTQAQFLAFAGNLYVLDLESNQILRFNGSGNGFLPGANWINDGAVANFSKVVEFVVDGSFWLLEDNSEVDKWALGKEEIFLLAGVENSSEFVDIYTDQETSSLYLLDKKNGKIVVFDKKGKYTAEYQSNEVKEATEIVVSEADGKIIFLSGSKLYSIEIKHK